MTLKKLLVITESFTKIKIIESKCRLWTRDIDLNKYLIEDAQECRTLFGDEKLQPYMNYKVIGLLSPNANTLTITIYKNN